ncbi:periplasmic chaperone for outer membrane proteins Skp [Polaribacter sp. KT25b]|uniref:OmpH family outer membrane protein n=1 Tax=Polaribacter sp. KT25b TaxID=1855336 RepID=UPI00087D3B9F|nr:OmpH family outer membrane protein [Polaribacter sp. KT25b]SDS36936.1 periplasmic chaperone for outer membrane proteins Skp [Polaribacter sp. KT25b]
MKNLKTLLLIAVFTLGLGGVANAQKIGHINYQRVIVNMPEARALQVTLEKLGKTYQDEIETMGKKIEAKRTKYTAEQNSQTPQINESRAQEVQQEIARYQQLRQTAAADIQQREQDGLKPISEKAQKAINEIAASKGILYVLEENSLIVKKGEDLYDAVKAKLGLLKDLPRPTAENK